MNQNPDPYAPPPRPGAPRPAVDAGPSVAGAPDPQWQYAQGQPPPFPGPAPQFPGAAPQFSGPAPTPRIPWWQRDGIVSRLLVFTGVAVTLIGVVMLLVIAAQNGLLRPEVRVGGGAVLAAALVAAGWRVVGRTGGRIGGTALIGTGVAGFYLDTVAVTAFYEWVPVEAGLVAAAIVAAAGMIVAVRIRSQALAVIVMIGAASLAPVLTSGLSPLLTGFLLVLMTAGSWPQIRYGWTALAPICTVPVVLAAFAEVVLLWRDGVAASLSLLLATALIALVSLATTTASSARRENALGLLTLPFAVLPAVLAATTLSRWWAVGICLALAAVIAAATTALPASAKAARTIYGLLAATLVVTAVMIVSFDRNAALPVLILALAAAITDRVRHHAVAGGLAQVGLGFGLLALIATDPPRVLLSESLAATYLTSTSVLNWALLAIAAVVAVSAVMARPTTADSQLWQTVDGVIAGYAAMCLLLSAGVVALGPSDGFAAAQFAITALLISAAAVFVHRGLTTSGSARLPLTLGLTLAATALSKLFLFDMAALSGVARAAAFLVVGLLLLALGTRYARVFAERAGDRDTRTHEATYG